MPSNKTQPTNISVDEYIKGIKIVQRREDAANLVEMLKNHHKYPTNYVGLKHYRVRNLSLRL